MEEVGGRKYLGHIPCVAVVGQDRFELWQWSVKAPQRWSASENTSSTQSARQNSPSRPVCGLGGSEVKSTSGFSSSDIDSSALILISGVSC